MQIAVQTAASCFSIYIAIPNWLADHCRITESRWPKYPQLADTASLKEKRFFCTSTCFSSFHLLELHFALQVPVTCGSTLPAFETRSAQQVFFRSALLSLRWWKIDWFVLILWPVPGFPFASSQILWRTQTECLPDFYDFICNIYCVPSPLWACLLQCQLLPEKVKVIFMAMQTAALLLVLPVMSPDLPCSYFPGAPDDFPCF